MLREILKKIPIVKWFVHYKELDEATKTIEEKAGEKAEIYLNSIEKFHLKVPYDYKYKVAQVYAKYADMEDARSVIECVTKMYDYRNKTKPLEKLLDDEVYNAAKTYDGIESEHILDVIRRIKNNNTLFRFSTDITKPSLVDAFKRFKNKNMSQLKYALSNSVLYEDFSKETIEFFDHFADHEDLELIADTIVVGFSILSSDNRFEYLNLLHVIKLYEDINLKDVCLAFKSVLGNPNKIHYTELYGIKIKEEVKKSKNPKRLIQRALMQDYTQTKNAIVDLDVRDHVNRDDLDQIISARRVALGIHKERNGGHQREVFLGFYNELNRAIGQGKSLRQKFEYLRLYCREVQEKIREHAEELMVVANA